MGRQGRVSFPYSRRKITSDCFPCNNAGDPLVEVDMDKRTMKATTSRTKRRRSVDECIDSEREVKKYSVSGDLGVAHFANRSRSRSSNKATDLRSSSEQPSKREPVFVTLDSDDSDDDEEQCEVETESSYDGSASSGTSDTSVSSSSCNEDDSDSGELGFNEEEEEEEDEEGEEENLLKHSRGDDVHSDFPEGKRLLNVDVVKPHLAKNVQDHGAIKQHQQNLEFNAKDDGHESGPVSGDSSFSVDVTSEKSHAYDTELDNKTQEFVAHAKPDVETFQKKEFNNPEVVVLDEFSSSEEERDCHADDTNAPSSSCLNTSKSKIPPRNNCVARRTRSKMWSLKTVDYSKYFKNPDDSDEDEYILSSPSYSSSSPRQVRVHRKESAGIKRMWSSIDDHGSHSESEYSFLGDGNKEDAYEMEKGMLRDTYRMKNDEDAMNKSWTEKSSRRKLKKTLKDESLFKMFLNTMRKDEEGLDRDKTNPLQDNWTPQGLDLPNLVKETEPFFFSFEDTKLAEKSEYDKAMDELWAEFDFVTGVNDIGNYNSEAVEAEDVDVHETKGHSSVSCSQEEHFFILDDEAGVICKFCSHVVLKARYILPPFATKPWGRNDRTIAVDMENASLLDNLCMKQKKEELASLSYSPGATVWDLIPGTKKDLYPHQQEGFEFIWKNLAGDIFLDNLKKPVEADAIGGCVISHAPGTGKSRLSIVFLQSFLKLFPECRPIILAPRGMLLMWEKEFKKWGADIPFHILNVEDYRGNEDAAALKLVANKRDLRLARLVKLYSWNKSSSILGVSYGLFEKLAGESTKHQKENAQISKILLEQPGLFIFDEGHTPRNERSKLWKVLEKIKAERRIILSGTPFQNNFMELYNTLCLVRPKFARKITQKRSRFSYKFMQNLYRNGNLPEKDEGRENWASLTNYINDDSIEELKSVISPFVHVHNGTVLRELPGLRECLIVLKPLPQQRDIIESIESIRSDKNFGHEYKVALAAIHPSLFVTCELSSEEKDVVDVRMLQQLRLDPSFGIKTKFVMEIVRLSESLDEKVLIFSQYIEPLSLVMDQLSSLFGWTEGIEVLQMDGKFRLKQRQASIDLFNDPKSDVRVLLASTKACCEGISLTGASRVVILDIVWNPSVENQAISRAFRIGQSKMVYTYHLIAHGTSEVEKYHRQVEKHQLSKLVFAKEGRYNEDDSSTNCSEDKILVEMLCNEKLKDMFVEVLNEPRELNLISRRYL